VEAGPERPASVSAGVGPARRPVKGGPRRRYPSDGSSKCRVVSVYESNPEEIEARKTRASTGFPTFGRIGGWFKSVGILLHA